MNGIPYKANKIQLSTLRDMVSSEPAKLVLQGEEQYEGQLRRLADRVVQQQGQVGVLLLAGPSASGKTTTAFKLSDYLVQRGIGAPVVSLDDFFVGVREYPVLPDGTADYESIQCLDLELLTVTLKCLLTYGRAIFPLYDFTTGSRSDETREITLGKGDVLIMEGIHALNPLLSEKLPQDMLLKIYVSVQSQFVDGKQELFSPREVRLIRRMTRDNFYRGYPPYMTLDRWPLVVEGEERYILPFRSEAQVCIDSVIGYEPCVFGQYLLPSLHGEELQRHREILRKLRGALSSVPTLNRTAIPKTSLLREFISDPS